MKPRPSLQIQKHYQLKIQRTKVYMRANLTFIGYLVPYSLYGLLYIKVRPYYLTKIPVPPYSSI
ncbi:hypothetical protein K502DRAFT_322820 [Neoconidiobolus thromboides FSU 785]|nr:hypothetical protein K502DRAFT_322820 [Neoconidiobolus thromboides FSU 785]